MRRQSTQDKQKHKKHRDKHGNRQRNRQKKRVRERLRQRTFDELGPGGKRKGAGRKPKGAQAGVSHRPRSEFRSSYPAHVTVKLVQGLPSLRNKKAFKALLRAFVAGKYRFGMRLLHFSVQSNHIHMIIEAEDRNGFARGMQGLLVRVAKGLNKLWDREGSVFADRYHDHVLRTPREVRNAIAYVLHNSRKHGTTFLDGPDPFTSSEWFDGFRDRGFTTPDDLSPVMPPRTWLARSGWRRRGLIAAAPGGAR